MFMKTGHRKKTFYHPAYNRYYNAREKLDHFLGQLKMKNAL